MKAYPRTKNYDSGWIRENQMGPNPVMLMEDLCENLDLRPGMRVLDMGCGRGLTSIFLAKEYGVTVFANDLWVSATDNLKRFEAAGVADRVFPIHAEAHALPYANEFFDVAVSVDSYHYYGTDETYFPCVYAKLVKPGGQFGIVCPGFTQEFENGFPETMNALFADDMFAFHSNKWWRKFWEKTGMVEIVACYDVEDAHAVWLDGVERSDEFIHADQENLVTLVAMAAVKKGHRKNVYESMNSTTEP